MAERIGAELMSGEGDQGKGEEAGTLWRGIDNAPASSRQHTHDTHSAPGINVLLCYFVATPLATVRE